MEFYCANVHTDGKEIQNLQTEILYAKHGCQCADFDENRA